MHRRTRITLGTATAAALTTGLTPLLLAATATPAHAAAAKYADDFNGDGYRDYAFGGYAGSSTAGAVIVVFGTATGPGTRTQTVTQNSPGVPGTNETDDGFGEALAGADFNRDGYADLAVGAPGENVSSRKDQGSVTILWGSASGLKGGTSVPVKGTRQSYGRFGSDLATGDFNGDGKPDLAAISASKAYVYRGSITKSGGVTGSVSELDKSSSSFNAYGLIAGKVTKDSATDLVILGTVATPTAAASDAWFIRGGATLKKGSTLRIDKTHTEVGDGVVADFNKDGYGDIAIGNPADSGYRGEVTIWKGAATGPKTANTRITQATSGVGGTPAADDWFGASVSAADVNGDGYADLAIGAYGERVSGSAYAGTVHILKGGSRGVTGTGSQKFTRATSGVPGSVEEDDCFGAVVRLRDTDRDGHADLFVSGMRSSLRLPGTSSGITTAGATEVPSGIVSGFLQ